MFVEVRGRLKVPGEPWRAGKIRAWVRWEDGVWSGFEPCLDDIRRRIAEGVVLVTPVGPAIPADSPQAAAILAADCFSFPGAVFKTDIEIPELPYDPNVVYGAR